MKRFLSWAAFAAIAFGAVPAHAAGNLHTWTFLSYINDALKKALGVQNDLTHAIATTIICLFLAVAGTIVGGSYRKKLATGDIEPSPNFSFSNFIEALVGMVLSLLEEIVGHGSKKYLPLLGTLALVILFSNCCGLLPGFALTTSNLNTTASMAIPVFLLYQYYGMREQGVLKHLEHFMGPLEGGLKYAMAPIMIPIELISHLARPMSLSLRLFGNMFGDHTILGVFMVGLGISLPLIFPMPFLALGLLVCIVQTLVFCLLTMVYIALAVEKSH